MVWVGINMLQFTGNASPVGAFDALPTALAVGKKVHKSIGLVEVELEATVPQTQPPRGSIIPKVKPASRRGILSLFE